MSFTIAKLYIYREDRWTDRAQPYKGEIVLVNGEAKTTIEVSLSNEGCTALLEYAIEHISAQVRSTLKGAISGTIKPHYAALLAQPVTEEGPL